MLLVPLVNVHRDWWCNQHIDLTTANTVINVPDFAATDLLGFTDQRFLIRSEYIVLFDRLVRFWTTAHRWNQRGVVITGQPGIGKSVFLVYALLRCLQNGQPHVFHMRQQTFTISANGVSEVDPRQPSTLITFPVFALIDSQLRKIPPPDELIRTPLLCPIFATSPDEQRYHPFYAHAAPFFVMDPWTDEELALGCGHSLSSTSLTDVSTASIL